MIFFGPPTVIGNDIFVLYMYLPICSLNEWSVQWQKPTFQFHLAIASHCCCFLGRLPLLTGNNY